MDVWAAADDHALGSGDDARVELIDRRNAQPRASGRETVAGRHETELERYDRNLSELMAELRVALPGVQVLFAFLLVVPFSQRFDTVSHFERRLYFATLLCTLLASILLIAPTLIHRLEFRRGGKADVKPSTVSTSPTPK